MVMPLSVHHSLGVAAHTVHFCGAKGQLIEPCTLRGIIEVHHDEIAMQL